MTPESTAGPCTAPDAPRSEERPTPTLADGMSKCTVTDSGKVLRWYPKAALEAGTELPGDEVARALYELRLAHSRGFVVSEAVFLAMRFDSIHVRGSESDSHDWGRTDLHLRAFFRDGKVERDPDYPTAPPMWREVDANGYTLTIRPNWQAALCGYVTVPVGHPAHGKGYNDLDLSAHGGLTYAEPEPDGGWTLGFDCSHYGDAGHPEYERGNEHRGLFDGAGIYRSREYVISEVRDLARQLSILAASGAATMDTDRSRDNG